MATSTRRNAPRIELSDSIERLPIVVRERPAARARELDAAEDAVVRQRVVQHEVARPDDVADHADVRRVAADHHDRVLAAEELAIASSSSRWSGFSPEAMRLAETDVP